MAVASGTFDEGRRGGKGLGLQSPYMIVARKVKYKIYHSNMQ